MDIKLSWRSRRELPWDGWNNCSLPLLSQPQPRRLSKKGAENQLRSEHCISGCYSASARLSAGRSKKGRLAALKTRNKGGAGVMARQCTSFSTKTSLDFFPTLYRHKHLWKTSRTRPSTYISPRPNCQIIPLGELTPLRCLIQSPSFCAGQTCPGFASLKLLTLMKHSWGRLKSPRSQHHVHAVRLQSASAAGPLAEIHISHYLSLRNFIPDLRNDLIKFAQTGFSFDKPPSSEEKTILENPCSPPMWNHP